MGRAQANQSDNYLRTARAAVYEIQSKVASAVRRSDPRLVEHELFDTLNKYGQDRSIPAEVTQQMVDKLQVPELGAWAIGIFGFPQELQTGVAVASPVLGPTPGTPPGDPLADETLLPLMDSEEGTTAAAEVGAAGSDEEPSDKEKGSSSETEEVRYWIKITRRGNFRRLHRFKGCWRRPGSCKQSYELAMEVGPGEYHAICKDCWPRGFVTKKDQVEESASSSQSSSTEDSSSN